MTSGRRIGIESGGTFTDLVAFNADGSILATSKTMSTPADPAKAVVQSLEAAIEAAGEGFQMYHGSTVATNAVLERKGATLGLLTTAGFGDVLHLQRHDRLDVYDSHYLRPRPLVDPELIREIPERMGHTGEPIIALDEDAARVAIKELLGHGVTAMAICLINAYANPAHEQRLRELVGDLGEDVLISLSSDVAPEFREFERASSTTMDAFIRPVVHGYLSRVAEQAAARGVHDVQIMQSNAGVVPVAVAAQRPLTTLLSGPAAGVSGAAVIATAAGFPNAITFDMGGTSSDVGIVTAGVPHVTGDFVVNSLPVLATTVDIIAVGAGGGSLITLDKGGMLQVGPQSAGADPGPACYGRGGTAATLTDANVVRGLYGTGRTFAADFRLDPALALGSFQALAQQTGGDVVSLAEDAFRVANAMSAAAMRVLSVERGLDPSDYALVAYGGAGPLHAASIAEDLGVSRVLVPPYAGVLSAYGLLASRFRRDFAHSELLSCSDLADEQLSTRVDGLVERARQESEAQHAPGTLDFDVSVDMRYTRQGHELSVPLPDRTGRAGAGLVEALVDRFHEAHELRFGHAVRDREVQITTLRVTASISEHTAPALRMAESDNAAQTTGEVFVDGRMQPCVFYDREGFTVGEHGTGPAVIAEATTTIYVPPGWTFRVDQQTNLILERADDSR